MLGIWREIFQRANAVLPREVALEVGLENLETLAIHCVGTVPSNVEARRMRLMNDEGIRHDDKTKPAFIDSMAPCEAEASAQLQYSV